MIETYNDKIEEIDDLLNKLRGKWQLDSIQWMDYDDVSQHIRRHIWLKWDLWQQHRPFAPWCRTVIANQIINLIRNNYGSFARPCLNCPHNIDGEACDFTKSKAQDNSCELYAKWEKKRSHIYNLKITVPLEDRVVANNTTELLDYFDFEESAKNLHKLVLKELANARQRDIYSMLYIEHLDDDLIAAKMGFTADGKKQGSRYKQLNNLKKKFAAIAATVLEKNDVIE